MTDINLKYIYDGAIASVIVASVILVAYVLLPTQLSSRYEKWLVGGFSISALTSLVLAGYYYQQMKGMGYSDASLLDTVDSAAHIVCVHGLPTADCQKCTNSKGESGCGCGN